MSATEANQPDPIAVDVFAYWLEGFAYGIDGRSIDGPWVAGELHDCLIQCGFALVKLPAPAGMDSDGQIWFDTTETRVDTTGREPEIYSGRNQRTVKQLREEAAELLSIAALVDAINAGAK